jgi:hypothetical protein
MGYLARISVDDSHWPADVGFSDEVLAVVVAAADVAAVVGGLSKI